MEKPQAKPAESSGPALPDHSSASPRLRVLLIFLATCAQLLDFVSDALVAYALAAVAGKASRSSGGRIYIFFGLLMLLALIRTSWLGVRRLRALGLRLPWVVLLLAPLHAHVASARWFLNHQ